MAQPNPWQHLPSEPPYILPEDAELVRSHNLKVDELYRVQLSVYPEPFIGRPDAPVVLLNLNPGWNPVEDPVNHGRRDFQERHQANLLHEPLEYPFYLLDPTLLPYRTKWWDTRLRTLIEATSRESVARNLLCIEFFPYHSKKYKRCQLLPSQRYGFALADAAVRRKAVIVVMRAKRAWMDAVPSLTESNMILEPNSTQSAYISPGNYNRPNQQGFDVLLDAIRRA